MLNLTCYQGNANYNNRRCYPISQIIIIVRYYPISSNSHVNLKSNPKGLGKDVANLEIAYNVGMDVGAFFFGGVHFLYYLYTFEPIKSLLRTYLDEIFIYVQKKMYT